MLYRIYRRTIIIIIPMFFLNVFFEYRIFPWLLIGGMFVRLAYVFVHDPLSKIPVKWQLPTVIISAAFIPAIGWWLRNGIMIRDFNVASCILTSMCLMYYPFFGEIDLFGKFLREDRANVYRIRVLCAVLIVLINVLIYFLDPFSMKSKLLNNGEPLLLIFILSIYSFALTNIFYRLELKTVIKSNKDANSYNSWLTIPACVLSNVLVLWFVFKGR